MKVTFDAVNNNFLVNGVKAAHLSGRSEVYVLMVDEDGKEKVVARFKYRSPKSSAKHWVKFMLQRMTSVEIIAALKEPRQTPLGLAETRFGYESPNVTKMKAERDRLERLRNTPITIVTL